MFSVAKPVFLSQPSDAFNQFAAFRADVVLPVDALLHVRIAARSFYRLYLNGLMVMHGPARSAHGTLRVDELRFAPPSGKVVLAIELAAYSTVDNYSNNVTCEPGLLIAEALADGQMLAATGTTVGTPWRCAELHYRRSDVELLSHSREIIEVYDLDERYTDWLTDSADTWGEPAVLQESPLLLARHAPLPDLKTMVFKGLLQTCGIHTGGDERKSRPHLQEIIRKSWYDRLSKRIVDSVERDHELPFTGTLVHKPDGTVQLSAGECGASSLLYDLCESAVGFLSLHIQTEHPVTIDLLHGDKLDDTGTLTDAATMVRWNLSAGEYELCSFEPYLVRYLKVVIRGNVICRIQTPELITYWYPDYRAGSFLCSDPDANAIYDAARRTLQASTLDIFMDCPERERGGWLCDSLWIARAARMILGDTGVERDFLENFLLSPADAREPWGFFPEVYPGSPKDGKSSGISTWSFWLALELCEYFTRSGDRQFVDGYRARMEQFVEGALRFRGPSGLLEHLPIVFIDWSQSNLSSNTQPISVPANAMFAHALCELAQLYTRPDWLKLGESIRATLRSAVEPSDPFFSIPCPDALELQDGQLSPKQYMSEAALFTDIWSGLFDRISAPKLIERAVHRMGPCPSDSRDPNVGPAELFIGLIIRCDMLARLDEHRALLRELKALYLPQIHSGPGTLFEWQDTNASLCHGMNGHAGVLLMREILGLGEPRPLCRMIQIAPHPCGLRWAQGTVRCGEESVFLRWSADDSTRRFEMSYSVPSGWICDVRIPEEFAGWSVYIHPALSPCE